ncbi:MAG: response regulator transcription factor [Methylomicrobium sp.]|nr:response regulator transcription factor [Methylomicrobium sp.]
MTNTTSALVLDDHPLSASGIADFLLSHCGFDAARSLSNVADFWAALDSAKPYSLAVVDFWLPDGASLSLLVELKLRCPSTRLLVISADDNTAVLDKVRIAGADGFLHKQESPDVFGQAVAALLQGDSWFHGGTPFAGREFSNKELPVTAAELGLTARQGQVLAMMLKGLPNKRIALNLSLSEQTVKEHMTGILARLGAHNRIEVITMLRGRRLE